MSKVWECFLNAVTEHELILPGERICVALSGGADSVCLLALCSRLSEQMEFTLSAAHLNHGLRPEAEQDASFCRQLCRSLQVPLFTATEDVAAWAARKKISVETAGRELRYRFFASLQQDKIALAHHKNDQAETVLLHLLRGSGTDGLGAMAPIQNGLIRPLLSVSRAEIEAFCREEGLSYCTDQSNLSRIYKRNQIRLDLLPLLEQLQPRVVDLLARTAESSRRDADQLRQDTESAWKMMRICEGGYCCRRDEFLLLSPALQRRVLRLAWERIYGSMQNLWYDRVESALAVLHRGTTGKRYCLGEDIWVENSYEMLRIYRRRELPPFRILLKEGAQVQPTGSPYLFTAYRGTAQDCPENCGWAFDYSLVQQGIYLRNRRAGDVICLNGIKQKLKKVLIDRKITRYERQLLVLAECGGTIIGGTGLGVAKAYRGKEDCLIVQWERTDEK